MKLFLWVFFGLVIAGLAFWMLTVQEVQSNPLFVVPIVLIYAASPIGSFWMFYMVIRYEAKPLPMLLLAFVPFASLWYYLERVRPGKLTREFRS